MSCRMIKESGWLTTKNRQRQQQRKNNMAKNNPHEQQLHDQQKTMTTEMCPCWIFQNIKTETKKKWRNQPTVVAAATTNTKFGPVSFVSHVAFVVSLTWILHGPFGLILMIDEIQKSLKSFLQTTSAAITQSSNAALPREVSRLKKSSTWLKKEELDFFLEGRIHYESLSL